MDPLPGTTVQICQSTLTLTLTLGGSKYFEVVGPGELFQGVHYFRDRDESQSVVTVKLSEYKLTMLFIFISNPIGGKCCSECDSFFVASVCT